MKFNVSVGIIAYNEEGIIKRNIESIIKQKTKFANIEEIIIISSGSTDKTNQIVCAIAKKEKRIKFVCEPKREGKSKAINTLLKKAKNEIIILSSADIVAESNCIEKLCSHFKNKDIGIVASRVKPNESQNKNLQRMTDFLWEIHHKVSLEKPKFGELIAFRKIDSIPRTTVDEEEIASELEEKGFKPCYEPRAVIHNKAPESYRELIRQRRRIYYAHHELLKRKNYRAATFSTRMIIRKTVMHLIRKPKDIIPCMKLIMIELLSRIFGWIDYKSKKDHHIWKISNSTKKFL